MDLTWLWCEGIFVEGVYTHPEEYHRMDKPHASRTLSGYRDDSWKFNPLHVLGESVALVLANWKLLARWAVLPFGLYVIHLVPLPHFDVGGKFVLLWRIAAPLFTLAMMWLSMVFSLRVYRLFLCGETHPAPYRKQMFERRTWKYLVCNLKIYLAMLVYSPVVLVCIFLIPTPITGIFANMESGMPLSTEKLAFLVLLCLPFWLYICPNSMLLFPDAAADGKGAFFAAGAMGAPARWRIVAVLTLTMVASYGLSYGWKGLAAVCGPLPEWADMALTVFKVSANFAIGIVSEVAGALVYQRLKAGWQAAEPELAQGPAADSAT